MIFLRDLIELVELYKTVYIKKMLSHFPAIKTLKNYLENPKKMSNNSVFHMEEKILNFSIKLAFLDIFTATDVSKYTDYTQFSTRFNLV